MQHCARSRKSKKRTLLAVTLTRAAVRPAPQQARSIETRRRLLEAAIESLVANGFHGATTAEVVRRAKLARGAYIHHFGSREELMTAALRHLAEMRVERLDRLAQALPEVDRVRRLVELIASEVYKGDLFIAMTELWVAARTYPSLKGPSLEVGADARVAVLRIFKRELGPTALADPIVRRIIDHCIDPMIGVGIVALLRGQAMNRSHIAFWAANLAEQLEGRLAVIGAQSDARPPS